MKKLHLEYELPEHLKMRCIVIYAFLYIAIMATLLSGTMIPNEESPLAKLWATLLGILTVLSLANCIFWKVLERTYARKTP